MANTSQSPLSVTQNYTIPVVLGDGLGIPVINSAASNGDGTITLSGTNFGVKPQAAPILWAFGTDRRNNGVPQPAIDFTPGVDVNDPTVWSTYVHNPVKFSDTTRYPGLGVSYWSANGGSLSNPLAHFDGNPYPKYSDEIYASARFKLLTDWHNARAIRVSGITGTFDQGPSKYEYGETLTFTNNGDTWSAQLVAITGDVATIVSDSGFDYVNATATGDTSGATFTSTEYLASSGGSKYFRMWAGGVAGPFNSITTNRLIGGYKDENGTLIASYKNEDGSDDLGYGTQDMTAVPGWRFAEVYINQKGNQSYQYFDIDNLGRRYVRNLTIPEGQKFNDRAMTLSQVGYDAAGGTQIIDTAFYWGEIYLDSTPKRVVLSNKPNLADIGQEQELQFLTAWTPNGITFEERIGALQGMGSVYAYVFTEEDKANDVGFYIGDY